MSELGRGLVLSYCDTETGTYTDIANVIADVGELKVTSKVVEIESNTYDETIDFVDKFIENANVDDLTFKVEYAPEQTVALYALLFTTQWFKITYKDDCVWTFQAIVRGFGSAQPKREKITNEVTLAVVDMPDFDAGTVA